VTKHTATTNSPLLNDHGRVVYCERSPGGQRCDAPATVEEDGFSHCAQCAADYRRDRDEAEDTGTGTRFKEVLFLYPPEQFDEFVAMMKDLRAEWGIEAARAIVFEAVKRCHAAREVVA
jgi:hypothetical protein